MLMMTVGDCLDYVDEYNDLTKPKDSKKEGSKSAVRKATQADFDNF